MKRSFCMRAALVAAAMVVPAMVSVPTARADIIIYDLFLDGPSEVPPVPTPGTGVGTVTVDTVLHTMRLQVTFSDLVGTVTVAHIHAATLVPLQGTAGIATGVPTLPGFPAGVTAGMYDMTFDMTQSSSYNPSYLTANGGTPASAEAALFQSFAEGRAYLNIHSSFRASGEIRGFLVPGPGGVGLLALAGLALSRRRR